MWAHKYDDFDLRCKDGAPQMLQSYSKKYQKITQLMRYGMQFRQWWQCRQLDNNCDNNRDSNLDNNLDNNLVDNIGDDWSKNIPPVYLKWSSTNISPLFSWRPTLCSPASFQQLHCTMVTFLSIIPLYWNYCPVSRVHRSIFQLQLFSCI